MQVVEVIPIRRGIEKETLSYFTKEDFAVGSFVKIPLRNKEIFGIVVKSSNALEEKTSLKRASFELRKLVKVETAGMLPKAFMQAARDTASYSVTTVGSILGAMVTKLVLESPELLSTSTATSFDTHEPLVLQQPEEERTREYKSVIRECFARNQSVMVLVPTHEDALRLLAHLSTGIEQYTFTTSTSSKKKIIDTLNAARAEQHPILIIVTPAFLFFDRPDLSTIIVERENSRSYRTLARPYFHYRIFIESYVKFAKKFLIYGDSVLSLGTLQKTRDGSYIERSPLTWRTKYKGEMRLIDMRRKNTLPADEEFKIFSKHTLAMLTAAVVGKRKVFLFGVRKGLAPSTICGHCGALLLCKNCGAPVVLHETKRENTASDRIYVCHHCGTKRDPLTVCDNCGSWKLIPLGIGIERIATEVNRLFPDTPLFVLDKDRAPDRRSAIEIAKAFASVRGGILIGTELAFLYLDKVPYTAVVTLDSLFSIPDFNIGERVYYFLDHIHAMTEVEMLVQTRNPNEPTFEFAKEGDNLGYFRREINERKELLYPPFSLFIKVSYTGTLERAREKAAQLKLQFTEWQPTFMEVRHDADARTLSMILRVPRNEWPNKRLQEALSLLTPDFLVKVDPESVL